MEYKQYAMGLNATLSTDGKGYWTNQIKSVLVYEAFVNANMTDSDDLYGELRVLFHVKDWNIEEFGLIYTDDKWEEELKAYFMSLGFSKEAAENIGYSEQGMQGRNYVSLDCGHKFVEEFIVHNSVEEVS